MLFKKAENNRYHSYAVQWNIIKAVTAVKYSVVHDGIFHRL